MSSHHPLVHNAVLFQLLAELEAYESHVLRLVEHWQRQHDVVLFGEAGQSMDRMRVHAISIPEISAPWVMVMISHTELMHNLWRMTKGENLDPDLEVEDHLAAVRALAARCRRLLLQGPKILH